MAFAVCVCTWSLGHFLKTQLTSLHHSAYVQPSPLRLGNANAKGPFVQAFHAAAVPVTRASLLPSFTQRVLGKPRLRLCTEDLGKLCSPGLEIQSLVNFHHRVTAKSHSSGQGGLPRRALCPCPLGDSATSGPVSLPSHSHH